MTATRYLVVITVSQFLCTSLWFAGNAILPNLVEEYGLSGSLFGFLTVAVQMGFISGTLVFAMLSIADRWPATRVFFICSVLGSASTLLLLTSNGELEWILTSRILTGFFLAGIYPVGMKIASDVTGNQLGRALGFLVGALVLGTALPYLLSELLEGMHWQWIVFSVSGVAVVGGLLMLIGVPTSSRKTGTNIQLTAFMQVFANKSFRSAAFGYFGHMWELYTFWALVPWFITDYNSRNYTNMPISLLSFVIIGVGAVSCVAAGLLSGRLGAWTVAKWALTGSGICCLISPLLPLMPLPVFVGFLLLWSVLVIADSPMFSTLVARYADPDLKGTALTIVTAVGFTITLISINRLTSLPYDKTSWTYLALAPGPILGVWAILRRPANS